MGGDVAGLHPVRGQLCPEHAHAAGRSRAPGSRGTSRLGSQRLRRCHDPAGAAPGAESGRLIEQLLWSPGSVSASRYRSARSRRRPGVHRGAGCDLVDSGLLRHDGEPLGGQPAGPGRASDHPGAAHSPLRRLPAGELTLLERASVAAGFSRAAVAALTEPGARGSRRPTSLALRPAPPGAFGIHRRGCLAVPPRPDP